MTTPTKEKMNKILPCLNNKIIERKKTIRKSILPENNFFSYSSNDSKYNKDISISNNKSNIISNQKEINHNGYSKFFRYQKLISRGKIINGVSNENIIIGDKFNLTFNNNFKESKTVKNNSHSFNNGKKKLTILNNVQMKENICNINRNKKSNVDKSSNNTNLQFKNLKRIQNIINNQKFKNSFYKYNNKFFQHNSLFKNFSYSRPKTSFDLNNSKFNKDMKRINLLTECNSDKSKSFINKSDCFQNTANFSFFHEKSFTNNNILNISDLKDNISTILFTENKELTTIKFDEMLLDDETSKCNIAKNSEGFTFRNHNSNEQSLKIKSFEINNSVKNIPGIKINSTILNTEININIDKEYENFRFKNLMKPNIITQKLKKSKDIHPTNSNKSNQLFRLNLGTQVNKYTQIPSKIFEIKNYTPILKINKHEVKKYSVNSSNNLNDPAPHISINDKTLKIDKLIYNVRKDSLKDILKKSNTPILMKNHPEFKIFFEK